MMRKMIVSALVLAVATTGLAVAEGPDLQQLIQETQRVQQENGVLRLVWWIPTEFWEISLAEDSSITQEQKEAVLQALDDFLMVAVVDGKFSALGTLTGAPKSEIIKKVTVDVGGRTLKPIAEGDFSGDARIFFDTMKPMLASMMGQLGEGMEFIAFEGRDAEKQRYADPKGTGSIKVRIDADEYTFRLPLGSLMPPMYDPSTGEEFPGNYKYSPFTGKSLQPSPPPSGQASGDGAAPAIGRSGPS